jgi:hypothetical protein
LRRLKRARISAKEIVLFYCTCVRPVLEYASPVFHHSLPHYLSDDIGIIQRRALKIILPDLTYNEALSKSGLYNLNERRETLCDKTFSRIVRDPDHKLHALLPPMTSECQYNLRNKRVFRFPRCKTNRFKNFFIISSAGRYQFRILS